MKIESELKQAELILDASGYCADEEQHDSLISLVKTILEPYWRKSDPRAFWLKAQMPNLGEDSIIIDEHEFDNKYTELLRLAAEGGCPEAQYDYGCELYELGEKNEAIKFYFKSAQQDYAPSQWCYGLDVLSGVGADKDEKIGLRYIRMAAEQRYEYAVEFLIDAYKDGKYGFNNEVELQKWQNILALL